MVRLKDIAEVCGVSVATVSRALNGLTSESRERTAFIVQTAKDMGYYPNTTAKVLKTSKTNNIGIIYEDRMNHEYFSSLFDELRLEAERNGYDLTFISRGGSSEGNYYEHARQRSLDGVIVVQADFESAGIIRLATSSIPTVIVDHVYDGVDCVTSDNRKSMEQIVAYAQNLGYMHIPQDRIVKVDDLGKFHDDKVCIITTGSQGEPMSGLYRMANASHKINIGFGDTVIISASAIPGNEVGVGRVIDGLFEKGAYVVYDRMADVHVSGHACREELKLMLHIAKPKFFIPAHGEFRHLMTHGRLALDMGIPEENIFVLNNGDAVTFTKKGAAKAGEVPSGAVMVDGSKSIEDAVILDRRELSSQGLVVAVVTLDKETGREIAPVELISRGFVYMKESDDLMAEAAQAVAPEVKRFETEDKANYGDIKAAVKSKLKSFFKSRTKRTPLIIPIVIEGETYDRDLG